MQHQSALSSNSLTSVITETTHHGELILDLDNVEDILDFSAHPFLETANSPHACEIANNPCSSLEMDSTYSSFENVEDILDFSAHPSLETANSQHFSRKVANDPCSSLEVVNSPHSLCKIANSPCSSSETANNKSIKKLLPQMPRRKTEKPVKLSEIKPIIGNFVHDEVQNVETERNSKRRFQCNFCGNKFTLPAHLRSHLRTHTGERPYFCRICRKRFSRSDYVLVHMRCHRKKIIHACCVCGKFYMDLTLFTDHCRSHDDSEYMRIAKSKKNAACFDNQLQKVKDPVPAEQIIESFCVEIEVVDNFTDKNTIVHVKNPIYSSHHLTTSICSDEVNSPCAIGSSNNPSSCDNQFP